MSSRLRLPPRRPIVTARVEDRVTGHWHLSAGFDCSGVVREFFLDAAGRTGASPWDALIHDMCICLSRDALQRGLTVADLARNLSSQPPSLLAAALATAAQLQLEFADEHRLIDKPGGLTIG